MKEEYGADHAINYRTHPDWEKEVLTLTEGEGADIVVGNSGNGTIAKFLKSLTENGQIALVGFLSHTEQIPDVVIDTIMKGANVRGIQTGSKQLYEQFVKFVHAKKLHFPIGETFNFSSEEQVQLAFKKLASQTNVGKVTIKIE